MVDIAYLRSTRGARNAARPNRRVFVETRRSWTRLGFASDNAKTERRGERWVKEGLAMPRQDMIRDTSSEAVQNIWSTGLWCWSYNASTSGMQHGPNCLSRLDRHRGSWACPAPDGLVTMFDEGDGSHHSLAEQSGTDASFFEMPDAEETDGLDMDQVQEPPRRAERPGRSVSQQQCSRHR